MKGCLFVQANISAIDIKKQTLTFTLGSSEKEKDLLKKLIKQHLSGDKTISQLCLEWEEVEVQH